MLRIASPQNNTLQTTDTFLRKTNYLIGLAGLSGRFVGLDTYDHRMHIFVTQFNQVA